MNYLEISLPLFVSRQIIFNFYFLLLVLLLLCLLFFLCFFLHGFYFKAYLFFDFFNNLEIVQLLSLLKFRLTNAQRMVILVYSILSLSLSHLNFLYYTDQVIT